MRLFVFSVVLLTTGLGAPAADYGAGFIAAGRNHPVAASRLQGLRVAGTTASPGPENPDPVAGVPRPKPPPPRRHPATRVTAGASAPAALASVGPLVSQLSYLDAAWQAYAAGDTRRALQLWQQAAAAGSDEARTNIAALYARGDGVARDLATAAQWLLPLAERGDANALFQLATLSRRTGRQDDFFISVRRAADLGSTWAQVSIGVRYYQGSGIGRDLSLAFQWYRRAAANYTLARQRYILDLPAPTQPAKPPSAASLWLNRLIDPDRAELATALAAYAAADYDIALSKLSALADRNIPAAVTALAIMRDGGLASTPDPDGALALFRHAAELGDADAQYRLGMRYARADTIGRDDAAATTWLRAAARQGHPQAAFTLGVLSLSGVLASRDPRDTAAYLRLAAEAGIALAQYDLALMYAKGEGVTRDPQKARDWLAAAANQGIPEARFAVGLAFVNSRADFALAHKWLAAATANAAGALRVGRRSARVFPGKLGTGFPSADTAKQ